MKCSKILKLFISLILGFSILIMGDVIYFNISYAANGTDALGSLDSYNGGNGAGSSRLQAKAEIILGAIQVIGVVVSVIILIAMGIKYMFGSIEEKSEYKETMIPYLIGAVLVFSGTTIPEIIYQIAQNINK